MHRFSLESHEPFPPGAEPGETVDVIGSTTCHPLHVGTRTQRGGGDAVANPAHRAATRERGSPLSGSLAAEPFGMIA